MNHIKQRAEKYKWKYNINIVFVLVAVFILTSIPTVVHATSTQDKINEANKNKNELEEQLDAKEDELNNLKDEQNTLKGQVHSLSNELTNISENLANLEAQISVKEEEILVTQGLLEEAKAREAWQFDSMKLRIQYMYERGEANLLEIIFGVGNFSELLNASYYIESLTAYDKTMLDEIIENRNFIEEEEATLIRENQELSELKVEAIAEQARVAEVIKQKSNSIAVFGNQIDDAEKEALRYEEELKAVENNLEALKEQLAREIALSQSAANSSWRDISEVTFAEGDRQLLANIIYCEAGGEAYVGQLAVGSVIINRLLSSVYPNTLVGVIYQNKQFSPVASGRLELALSANRATESCYKAADEAMRGITNVGNCVYFRTPIEGLTGITIGGHIFY